MKLTKQEKKKIDDKKKSLKLLVRIYLYALGVLGVTHLVYNLFIVVIKGVRV